MSSLFSKSSGLGKSLSSPFVQCLYFIIGTHRLQALTFIFLDRPGTCSSHCLWHGLAIDNPYRFCYDTLTAVCAFLIGHPGPIKVCSLSVSQFTNTGGRTLLRNATPKATIRPETKNRVPDSISQCHHIELNTNR